MFENYVPRTIEVVWGVYRLMLRHNGDNNFTYFMITKSAFILRAGSSRNEEVLFLIVIIEDRHENKHSCND